MDNSEFFRTRRTVRAYASTPVSDELLREMLSLAAEAPTTGNMQLYSVVVTRQPERLVALAPLHFSQPAAVSAPVMLTFCADINRFVRWCEERDAKPGFDNFQSFVAAMLDVTIFAQQFCTIAEMNGLGCCYLGTTTYTAPKIAELLKLPKRVVPIITLSVGYPQGESEKCDRLPVEAVMHFEEYRDYSADDINKLYAEKEAREDSRRFIEENAKATLAQVFADVRYPKSTNEQFSAVFVDFLRKQDIDF